MERQRWTSGIGLAALVFCIGASISRKAHRAFEPLDALERELMMLAEVDRELAVAGSENFTPSILTQHRGALRALRARLQRLL